MSPDRRLAPKDKLSILSSLDVGDRFETVLYEEQQFYRTNRAGNVLEKLGDGGAAEFVNVEYPERDGRKLRETLSGLTPVIDWGPSRRIAGGRENLENTVARTGGLRFGLVPIIGPEGGSGRGGPPGMR